MFVTWRQEFWTTQQMFKNTSEQATVQTSSLHTAETLRPENEHERKLIQRRIPKEIFELIECEESWPNENCSFTKETICSKMKTPF